MADVDMSKYPQHAKLEAISEEERNAIGSFLEWLGSQGYQIGKWRKAGNNGQPRHIPATEERLEEIEETYGLQARLVAQKRGVDNPAFESWPEEWLPMGADPERWLAEFYGIDRKALSMEKQRMYELLVKAHQQVMRQKLEKLPAIQQTAGGA